MLLLFPLSKKYYYLIQLFCDCELIFVAVKDFSQFIPSYFFISIHGLQCFSPQSMQLRVNAIPSGFDLGIYHGKIPHVLQNLLFAVFVPHSYKIVASSKVSSSRMTTSNSSFGIMMWTFLLMLQSLQLQSHATSSFFEVTNLPPTLLQWHLT